ADGPPDRRAVLLLVVDAHDLADGGHEVQGRRLALDDLGAFLVGLADDLTALDAAAGHHQVPGARIVVAARLGAAGVDVRRAPELAHPDDQRRVEQAALLQI